MRLSTYERRGARRLAAWVADSVVDLPDAVGHPAFPSSMEALVARNGGTTLDAARDALARPDALEGCWVARPRLLVPLFPSSICEVLPTDPDRGAAGGGRRSLLGPNERLPWPKGTRAVRCRVQVACVVGRPGRSFTARQASRAIFGYTLMADWLAMDGDGAVFATSLGPWVLTADELDVGRTVVTVCVDGEVRAEGAIDPTRWSFPDLVAQACRSEEVAPGDVFGSAAFGDACDVDLDHRSDRGALVEMDAGGFGSLSTRVGPKRL